MVAYKGGCCSACGYKKSLAAMDFHHLNPAEKDFEIGGLSSNWEKIAKELDKCVLLCANCHRELHEELSLIPIG